MTDRPFARKQNKNAGAVVMDQPTGGGVGGPRQLGRGGGGGRMASDLCPPGREGERNSEMHTHAHTRTYALRALPSHTRPPMKLLLFS